MTSPERPVRIEGRITTIEVERWVACGLLRPDPDAQGWQLAGIDVARARLLAELSDELGFDPDSLETVVGLLDQVHALRRQLALLGRAIAEQPPESREAIALSLRRLSAG